MNTQELLHQIIESDVVGSVGKINFSLKDVSVEVKDISVVGNILQEWLEHFMLQKGIYFRKNDNTQSFPDFLLDPKNSRTENLLEVKAFTGSPNFDVANFSAYARSLRDHAYRLDSDYLILQYSAQEDGVLIKNVWLKKVWEICSGSERSPLKIQWKQGIPFNIRPATWYSDNTKYKPFESMEEFLRALNSVIGMAGIDSSVQKNWLSTVYENYKFHTGRDITAI